MSRKEEAKRYYDKIAHQGAAMNLDTPNEAEWSLIFDSWARSWMKSPWSGTFRNCDYPAMSRASMSEIVDRPTTVVTVMWLTDEDGDRRVMGYSVSEPSRKLMHWVSVKRNHRGQGIAKLLTDHAVGGKDRSGWVYTHKTRACDRLFRGMRHDKASACMKG